MKNSSNLKCQKESKLKKKYSKWKTCPLKSIAAAKSTYY